VGSAVLERVLSVSRVTVESVLKRVRRVSRVTVESVPAVVALDVRQVLDGLHHVQSLVYRHLYKHEC
jgi:hypothetical protein